MKHWQKRFPSYEGDEPFLYLAFAPADGAKVWAVLRPLLERGCRVWYCAGASGSGQELLRRQERAKAASLTLLYLSDALCADKESKSLILVNQKLMRPILCLDPDGTDRRLAMGLREDIPHIPLGKGEEWESAVLHAPGFSREILDRPVKVGGGDVLGRLTALFCALAVLAAALAFAGSRYLPRFRPEREDELVITDAAILSALREQARGGPITLEMTGELKTLSLSAMPESWDELELLPALERIRLPQQAVAEGGTLPEGDYIIELSGGTA